MDGLILSGVGGRFTVMDANGTEYVVSAQTKLRRQHIAPMVGDHVGFTPGENGNKGWLETVYERKNSLIRPPVANIDVMVMVAAAGNPQPDLLLVDRMLMFARQRDITPVIVINKTDEDAGFAERIAEEYSGSLVEVLRTNALTGEGVDALRERLKGTTHCFCGQSGVGKSSLINALYGTELETGELSRKIERGKNTTRHSRLLPLENGGRVLDTPGFSLLELELMDPVKMREYYPEFEAYEGTCRFSPCMHVSEPDCRVCEAVRDGKISCQRYERYKTLFNDMKEKWRDRYD